MKSENYINIQGWMRTELDLKGNDLLIYSIIYGFSQEENQRYTGSLQYLADWCGCTKQGALKNLQRLVEKGLIQKEQKEGTKAAYFCNLRLPQTGNLSLPVGNLRLTNNIDNKKIENKKSLSKDKDLDSVPEKTNFLGSIKNSPHRKDNLYDQCTRYIDSFIFMSAILDGDKLRKSLIKFLDNLLKMSREDSSPLYYNAFVSKLKKLNSFDKSEWQDIVDTAVENSWKNFYKKSGHQSGKKFQDSAVSEVYTEEELAKLEELDKEREARGLQTNF